MPLEEALAVLGALAHHLPPELGDVDRLNADQWTEWTRRTDAKIRARLDTGDEDSVVNLLLYGTTFTRRPRATPGAMGGAPDERAIHDLMDGRLDDLVYAVEAAGSDERMQFVRHVIERHGVAVSPSTRAAVRRYLESVRSRVFNENQRYVSRLAAAAATADDAERRAAYATVYQDRGLSSDTSLARQFRGGAGIQRDARPAGAHAAGHTARGIVGPGLDFVDKAQGYDFYPVQSLQPFAVADSLRRLALGQRTLVTAFDISERVLAHLEHARDRASRGEPYVLNLVLEKQGASSLLTQYWRDFGRDLSEPAPATRIPSSLSAAIRARAVAVRSDVVLDVTPAPLDVVVERLPTKDRLDLIVATNVLVYYEPLGQALAVRNIATMLREGGLLFTNQPVPAPDTCGFRAVATVAVPFDEVGADRDHARGDSIYVYRKAYERT
jgi:SAM-dependent methyltransferase